MTSDQNKDLVRRFFHEVISQGNLDAATDYLAADFVEHEELPGSGTGTEVFRQFFTMIRTAFPDLQFVTEDLIAEGDKVVVRSTMRGTHRGDFQQLPPTNRRIEMPVIDIVRVVDGKVTEHWGLSDNLGLLQQLGAIPAPGQEQAAA